MFVAGSRPSGQSPEYPVASNTVSAPPARGPVLAGATALDELLLLLLLHAATARASSTAVPASPNLRIVFRCFRCAEPNLMAFTYSISGIPSKVCDKKRVECRIICLGY